MDLIDDRITAERQAESALVQASVEMSLRARNDNSDAERNELITDVARYSMLTGSHVFVVADRKLNVLAASANAES